MKKEEKFEKKFDDIVNQIQDLMKNSEIEYWKRKQMAIDIAFEAINWSSSTFYEAIGMFEEAKNNYRVTWKDVEEQEEKEENGKANLN